MATGSRDDAERRFWERYRNLLLKQGVKLSAVRWYVLRAEYFIQSFLGRRLAGLARHDVDDYLARLGQDWRLQPWQFRQAVDAIRNLYSIVHTEWADGLDLEFWRDSARTLEEQHSTTAREHAPVTPEEFAKGIGEWRFAPLIREHLDVFARFSTVMRTRGLSIRTEKSYLGWCCRFLSRFGGSGPENLGALQVAAFLEELAVERNVSVSTQYQALNTLVTAIAHLLAIPVDHAPGWATTGVRSPKIPHW